MNLSELFIRRPVMTVLLNLAMVVAGVIAYRQIPIAALPPPVTASTSGRAASWIARTSGVRSGAWSLMVRSVGVLGGDRNAYSGVKLGSRRLCRI